MKKIAITGTLTKKRAEYVNEITRLGHKFAKSVSKTTDYLVIGGDKGTVSNKRKDAEAKGVQVLSEDELKAMISGWEEELLGL